MPATCLRTARALIALVLAMTTVVALIGADLHVELQGYCDSADDYMLYVGASSMELNSGASPVSISGIGLVAVISGNHGDHRPTCHVTMLEETYSCREHDGVAQLVDRPG